MGLLSLGTNTIAVVMLTQSWVRLLIYTLIFLLIQLYNIGIWGSIDEAFIQR